MFVRYPIYGAAREAGAALLNDVRVFLSRFIAYPREHAKVAHVLWIVRAHLMRAADAVQAQGQVKTVLALIPPQPPASPIEPVSALKRRV
jgi:hypothetical protein